MKDWEVTEALLLTLKKTEPQLPLKHPHKPKLLLLIQKCIAFIDPSKISSSSSSSTFFHLWIQDYVLLHYPKLLFQLKTSDPSLTQVYLYIYLLLLSLSYNS